VNRKPVKNFRSREIVELSPGKAMRASYYVHIMPSLREMPCMIPHHLLYSIDLRKKKRTYDGDLHLSVSLQAEMGVTGFSLARLVNCGIGGVLKR
jgi:hypothetical protein